MKLLNKINNLPVAVISTFGHNGIDWLHSLLDSHPQIIIMPGFSFYRTYDTLKLEKINSNEKLASTIAEAFLNNKSYHVKRRQILFNIHEKIFFEESLNLALKNDKSKTKTKKIFNALHYAFLCINKSKNIQDKKIIVVQEHVPWHSNRFIRDFNDVKFIFMMRDPRPALAGSWRRLRLSNTSNKINSYQFDHTLLYWKYSEHFVNSMKNKKPYILKNEDIHFDHQHEMTMLSKHLNINFDESMLTQTFNGVEWLGESAYINEEEKFPVDQEKFYQAKEIEKRWRKEINALQILSIEVLTKKVMKLYNYNFDSKNTLLKKIKGYKYIFSQSYKNQSLNSKSSIRNFLALFRNFLRRIFIVFYPKLANKIFKII
tara:strand:- start:5152 stop:6270 length:1119 start_codon:yes stop_codon:yes gene_type:complete